jgi:hypothetical protein
MTRMQLYPSITFRVYILHLFADVMILGTPHACLHSFAMGLRCTTVDSSVKGYLICLMNRRHPPKVFSGHR